MARVRAKLNQTQLSNLIADLPKILNGAKQDRYNLYKIFWGAVAHSMFTSISEAYEAKSEGQADDLGNTWDDLDRDYKAYKRPVRTGEIPSNLRRRLKKSNNSLGLLTPGQHKTWQKIFGTIYHSQRYKVGEEEALQLAGQIAWTRLKQMGAQTKRDVLGDRKVEIMRVSDKLYLSLSPGKFNPSTGYKKKNSRQVFELRRGVVRIGTEVPYAAFHDETRPVWPDNVDEWIDKAIEAGTNAVHARLLTVM